MIFNNFKRSKFAKAIYAGLVILGIKKDRELLKRIMPDKHIAPIWSEGDNLALTSGWEGIDFTKHQVFINRNVQPKVLFLNSLGGSISRLMRALMLHEGIQTDCFVNAYYPKRNLVYPLETNVNGIFTHKEWREFLSWAVTEYDIVQSSGLPSKPGLAECYDWLSDRLGPRHIWRATGFVHHYLLREEILPSSIYKNDLNVNAGPSLSNFPCRTFPVRKNYFELGNSTLFYSSPEKGAYFKGENKIWLPSIRNPAFFNVVDKPVKKTSPSKNVKIYVPIHSNAIFKGLDVIMAKLKHLQNLGHEFSIITPENAQNHFPHLDTFKDNTIKGHHIGAYPIPNHRMPNILKNVDLVIDQFIMGSYGNTGIEAMMSGLPVIGQKKYAEISDSPIINTDIENFEVTFLNLLYAPNTWNSIGQKGREWALMHHSPKVVSKIANKQYHKILQGLSGEV